MKIHVLCEVRRKVNVKKNVSTRKHSIIVVTKDKKVQVNCVGCVVGWHIASATPFCFLCDECRREKKKQCLVIMRKIKKNFLAVY